MFSRSRPKLTYTSKIKRMIYIPYFYQLADKILSTLPEGVIIHDIPVYLRDREYYDCWRELFDLVDPKKLKLVDPERSYFGRPARYYGAERGHIKYTVDIRHQHIHFRIYVEQEPISFMPRKGSERW
jgi:hypothetical protein